jgi:hypothetical protein
MLVRFDHSPPSLTSKPMLTVFFFSFVTAIWDNRTVYHSAIFDYAGLGVRTGHRAVGIGEQPYLDGSSLTRMEALAKEADGGWEHF